MYFDNKPCSVCGSAVDLRPRTGPTDRVVGADPTVDERVCTNPDCPTHREDASDA